MDHLLRDSRISSSNTTSEASITVSYSSCAQVCVRPLSNSHHSYMLVLSVINTERLVLASEIFPITLSFLVSQYAYKLVCLHRPTQISEWPSCHRDTSYRGCIIHKLERKNCRGYAELTRSPVTVRQKPFNKRNIPIWVYGAMSLNLNLCYVCAAKEHPNNKPCQNSKIAPFINVLQSLSPASMRGLLVGEKSVM
jgi:hypothetical protein